MASEIYIISVRVAGDTICQNMYHDIEVVSLWYSGFGTTKIWVHEIIRKEGTFPQCNYFVHRWWWNGAPHTQAVDISLLWNQWLVSLLRNTLHTAKIFKRFYCTWFFLYAYACYILGFIGPYFHGCCTSKVTTQNFHKNRKYVSSGKDDKSFMYFSLVNTTVLQWCHNERWVVGLWAFLLWAPTAKRKDHHGVSSGWISTCFTQILAYLVHNMSRSQLYLGFGHFGWLPSFFGQKHFGGFMVKLYFICWNYSLSSGWHIIAA